MVFLNFNDDSYVNLRNVVEIAPYQVGEVFNIECICCIGDLSSVSHYSLFEEEYESWDDAVYAIHKALNHPCAPDDKITVIHVLSASEVRAERRGGAG